MQTILSWLGHVLPIVIIVGILVRTLSIMRGRSRARATDALRPIIESASAQSRALGWNPTSSNTSFTEPVHSDFDTSEATDNLKGSP